MKRCFIAMALFVAACNSGSTQPVSQSKPVPAPIKAQVATSPQSVQAAHKQPVASGAQTPAPTIPQGARFTIFCESFSGDDHVQRATELKNILMSNARNKDWYVIHQEGQSTIYHGYYREFEADAATDAVSKKDAERAKSDKQLVESLPNPLNRDQKLFPRAIFVSLDSPDPDAPAEWNLVNTHAFWSVQIAAYSGYDRKQAAVESVREARKMNIPAYYFHGPSYSHVCIGAWPESAVRERSNEQVNSINQNSTVFVDVRGGEISNEMRENLQRDGKPVQVVVPKVEILDKSLIDTLNRYPEHAVDGYTETEKVIDPVTKQESLRAKRSMLVRIPATDGTSHANQVDDARPPTLIQPSQTNNLGARLKGLNQ